MGQELTVGTGLEDGAALFQVVGNLTGVHHIAIGRYGEVSAAVVEEQRLYVVQAAFGGIGILDTANTQVAQQMGHFPIGEDFAQQAQATVTVILTVLVKGGNATAFLAAVLEVMQTVIDSRSGVGDAIYSKNSH